MEPQIFIFLFKFCSKITLTEFFYIVPQKSHIPKYKSPLSSLYSQDYEVGDIIVGQPVRTPQKILQRMDNRRALRGRDFPSKIATVLKEKFHRFIVLA